VKTEDVFGAESELDFGLDMGDTVKFQKGKIGKQLKIAPTEEDIKKTTPDKIQPDKPDMTITHEDREKVKRLREIRKLGRPKTVKE
jgi:hypothetical protein